MLGLSSGRCWDAVTIAAEGCGWRRARQTLRLRTDEYRNVIVTIYAAFLQ